MQNNTLLSPAPWWKFGHMWLVFGGPAVVVVASFITLYLAVTRPDQLVTEENFTYRDGVTHTGDAAGAANLAPAIKARNHAQTGVVEVPKSDRKP